MFAPEGYRHFDDLIDEVEDLSAEHLDDREEEIFLRAGKYQHADILRRVWRGSMEFAIAARVISSIYELKMPIRIASPLGNVIVPSWIVFSLNPVHHGKDNIPLITSAADDIIAFTFQRMRGRHYAFIDSNDWMVDIPDLRGFSAEQLGKGDIWVKQTAKYLLPFDGWALCVKESFSAEQCLPALGIEAGGGSRGRPPLIPRVESALRKHYPDGKSCSWKEITERVSGEIGETVAVRTVQRAMRQLQGKMRQKS
ncbi:hypothetical protein [Paracoccus sp. PAMC 22219]|uniref:hypothetical protein n=1 Tax=Paracoccus sp. PAMC 22219 TaxID=1569209 RepID=UPI0012E00434|nr:hypothetical protein [Paracoccus sp. PAMC 22219]